MWINKERAREIARKILHTNDTPERTAFAFAVGVGVAFCPFLGLHTLIALILAFALRLNRLAVMTGTFANNPYTLFPIITSGLFLGSVMTGNGVPDFNMPDRTDFHSFAALGDYMEGLKPLFVPFVLGSSTLSLLTGGVTYVLTLPLVRRLRAHHEAHLRAKAAAEAAAAAAAAAIEHEPPRAASSS